MATNNDYSTREIMALIECICQEDYCRKCDAVHKLDEENLHIVYDENERESFWCMDCINAAGYILNEDDGCYYSPERYAICDICGDVHPISDMQEAMTIYHGFNNSGYICNGCTEEFDPPICPLYDFENLFATPDCCTNCEIWTCPNHL